MSTHTEEPHQDARTREPTDVMDLVAAVAARDAAPEDIAAQLRQRGYDALDVVTAALARAARQPAHHRRARRPVDVRSFAQPSPPELAGRTVHGQMRVPFLMNGTLYDPQDVRRFDGRELHFVAAPDRDLIAFDDKSLIARVWELSFIAPLLAGTPITPQAARDSGSGLAPHIWYGWPDVDEIGAYFYEDAGPDWGSDLYLPPNYGYWDLTRVGMGFLGTSDWNDEISAVQVKNHATRSLVCVLHEHVNMAGASLTCIGVGHSTMVSLGWNDRASSVECW